MNDPIVPRVLGEILETRALAPADLTLARTLPDAAPGEGTKFDTGKPRPALIPGVCLLEIGRVLAFGAKKYKAENWRLVADSRARYGDALLRHFCAWRDGQVRDPETGYYELAHVATNAIFLLYHEIKGVFP